MVDTLITGGHLLTMAGDGVGFVEDGAVPGRYQAWVMPAGAGPGALEVRVLFARSGNLAEPEEWTEVSYPVERL